MNYLAVATPKLNFGVRLVGLDRPQGNTSLATRKLTAELWGEDAGL